MHLTHEELVGVVGELELAKRRLAMQVRELAALLEAFVSGEKSPSDYEIVDGLLRRKEAAR